MDATLGMSGDFPSCSSFWIMASLLLDMLFTRWLKDVFFFFVRLSTASREFWDTEGGGRTGFLEKKLQTILQAFAFFFSIILLL